MSLTMEQGSAAVAHLRDQLGVSNRELGRVLQDRVDPDAFIDLMSGDDSAITREQSQIIGNEVARYVPAEGLDRELTQRQVFSPLPGFREVMGLRK